jgi:ABC-type proline/glycine betaine transport system substrate-binding protein
MKIASSTGAAQAAVSGFAGIESDSDGQQVSLGTSNIASMRAGAKLTNKVLRDVSKLVSGVKAEADRVTALASKIEARDTKDASGLKGKS